MVLNQQKVSINADALKIIVEFFDEFQMAINEIAINSPALNPPWNQNERVSFDAISMKL